MLTDNELSELIDEPSRRSDVSAVEMTEAFLDRIGRVNPDLKALITVTAELAIQDALRVDHARRTGQRAALDGLPVVVKDNIDVAGVPTTSGSRLFEHHGASADAETVRRLRKAGAIVLGKSNMHELAYGATCINPFYGTVRNPWDLERIPGGSSGGSAAALAADLCIAALGTDTGGSVRLPAALVGVSGLRPTFGCVSNSGVYPVSWSLDTVGPMARAVEDVAKMFAVTSGYDAGDPRARTGNADQQKHACREIDQLRIGVPSSFFFENLDGEVERVTRSALDVFRGLGARLVEISIPGVEAANADCTTIIRSDALALNREHCSASPERFGDDVLMRLRRGEAYSAVDLAWAIQRMHVFQRYMREVFEQVDVIVTPTVALLAPRIEEAEALNAAGRLISLTYPWSFAHLPAISIPCGISRNGLPVGLQLAAAECGEAQLFSTAARFQRVTDWHRARPCGITTG